MNKMWNRHFNVRGMRGVCRWLRAAVMAALALSGGASQAAKVGEWEVLTRQFHAFNFIEPHHFVVDMPGNFFFVDTRTGQVHMRTPQGTWTLIASTGSQTGQVNGPQSLAVDAKGNLFIADGGNRRVQMRTPQGDWSVIASTGNLPGLHYIRAMTVDGLDNLFVVVDQDPGEPHDIRIHLRTPQGDWSEIASRGSLSDPVSYPSELAVDGKGNLFIVDWVNGNSRVRMRTPGGDWSEIASTGHLRGQVHNPKQPNAKSDKKDLAVSSVASALPTDFGRRGSRTCLSYHFLCLAA